MWNARPALMAVVDDNLRSNAFPVNLIIGYYQTLLATKAAMVMEKLHIILRLIFLPQKTILNIYQSSDKEIFVQTNSHCIAFFAEPRKYLTKSNMQYNYNVSMEAHSAINRRKNGLPVARA